MSTMEVDYVAMFQDDKKMVWKKNILKVTHKKQQCDILLSNKSSVTILFQEQLQ